jgi:hypothetical protein
MRRIAGFQGNTPGFRRAVSAEYYNDIALINVGSIEVIAVVIQAILPW